MMPNWTADQYDIRVMGRVVGLPSNAYANTLTVTGYVLRDNGVSFVKDYARQWFVDQCSRNGMAIDPDTITFGWIDKRSGYPMVEPF